MSEKEIKAAVQRYLKEKKGGFYDEESYSDDENPYSLSLPAGGLSVGGRKKRATKKKVVKRKATKKTMKGGKVKNPWIAFMKKHKGKMTREEMVKEYHKQKGGYGTDKGAKKAAKTKAAKKRKMVKGEKKGKAKHLSEWQERLKAYCKKHGVSLREAMMALKKK